MAGAGTRVQQQGMPSGTPIAAVSGPRREPSGTRRPPTDDRGPGGLGAPRTPSLRAMGPERSTQGAAWVGRPGWSPEVGWSVRTRSLRAAWRRRRSREATAGGDTRIAGLGPRTGPVQAQGSPRVCPDDVGRHDHLGGRETGAREPQESHEAEMGRQRCIDDSDSPAEQGLEVASPIPGRGANGKGASAHGDVRAAAAGGNALEGACIGEEARRRGRHVASVR